MSQQRRFLTHEATGRIVGSCVVQARTSELPITHWLTIEWRHALPSSGEVFLDDNTQERWLVLEASDPWELSPPIPHNMHASMQRNMGKFALLGCSKE